MEGDGLGQLGFWLTAGMIAAAAIVSGALKERDKEREKQATLRALLEKDGKSAAEVIAYLREKDAAEVAEAARERASDSRTWKRFAAVVTGILAFGIGIFAFGAVRYELMSGSGSVIIPIVPMLGIWAAGGIAATRIWRSANQKNDAHPDA